MRKLDGSATVNGRLVFCGQPWVQNATVRESNDFGNPFDQHWYDQVIEVCWLTRDLETLPAGDRTEPPYPPRSNKYNSTYLTDEGTRRARPSRSQF
jgi:hypothetical protein